MKKLLVLFLALTLVLSIIGCAKDTEPTATEPTEKEYINDWGSSKFSDVTELKFKIEGKEIELPMKYSDFCEMFEFEVLIAFTDERYDEEGKKSLLYEQIISIENKEMSIIVTNYEMDASYDEESFQKYLETGDIVGLGFYSDASCHQTQQAIKPEYISNINLNDSLHNVVNTLGQGELDDREAYLRQEEYVLSNFGTPDIYEERGIRYKVPNWKFDNEENLHVEFWFSLGHLYYIKFGVFQNSF